MQKTSAMSQTGEKYFKVLAAVSLDSANEEEILLSLPQLVRGGALPSQVHFYHVLTPHELRLSYTAGQSFLNELEQLKRNAENKLAHYAEAAAKRVSAPVTFSYSVESQEVASPGEEIAQLLRKEPFDLLTLVFKQRKRWERFFGSTALWDILENASIPILILPAPLTIPPKRILWATQMQPEEFPYLAPLISLVRILKATLYCVKVNTPYAFYPHRTFQRYILEMCDYIIDRIDPDFVPEECILYNDRDLAEGILHAAQDFLMDIVALSADEPTLDWKVVDKVLEQHIPVLLLRQR